MQAISKNRAVRALDGGLGEGNLAPTFRPLAFCSYFMSSYK
jgi:hypothetical protein